MQQFLNATRWRFSPIGPRPTLADPIAVDTSAELLRTIAEVLDIRSVFPRISEIVKEMLPHDALDLMFHDRGGRVTLEAKSSDDLAGHCAWSRRR